MSTHNDLLYFARFCAGSTTKQPTKHRAKVKANKELCQVYQPIDENHCPVMSMIAIVATTSTEIGVVLSQRS